MNSIKHNNTQTLTNFEIGYNLTLIILVSLVFIKDNDDEITKFSNLSLGVIFFMRVIPFDLPSYMTIYSRKILNFIIQSTLLFIMYTFKEKFMYNKNDVVIPIICFLYFNIMRFFGELYIGKDPIWLGGKAIGRFSDSKKRLNSKKDAK